MAELIKKENSQVSFKFTVEQADFNKAIKQAYNQSKNRFSIPGFRKGKAPQKVIEKHYGEGVFFEDALNIVLPKAYEAAVEELELKPVDRPDIDVLEMETDQPILIKADVYVVPDVELGDYKGVAVDVEKEAVNSADIDAEIDKERQKNARMINVTDRPAALDDTVIINYKGSIDGELFEGGSADNHQLKLGSHQFIGDFEDQLVGVSAGESKTVEVAFPDDYHAENLAGKPAVFEVEVNDIKVEELPELDDEFIKDISEFDTVDAYRSDVEEKLLQAKEDSYQNKRRSAVVESVVDATLVDIPDVMVDHEVDHMVREFDMQLRYQGMSIDQYFELTNTSEDDIRTQMRDDALEKVKTQLTLDAIADAEGIVASDDDVDSEVEKIAEAQQSDVEKIRQIYGRDDYQNLKDYIVSRKTVDFLLEHAKSDN